MAKKSGQLQIRVTAEEKAELKRRAQGAGLDMSSYVLRRALPPTRRRLDRVLGALRDEPSPRLALAELNDLLSELAPSEFGEAVEDAEVGALSPFLKSYVAAMVEVAAKGKGVAPPRWTARVGGVDDPFFATPLKAIRLHLLKSSRVPFKRRNLFVDATIGDRV